MWLSWLLPAWFLSSGVPGSVTLTGFRRSIRVDRQRRRTVTMDQGDWLAERFREHRARLRAVAYRMLGSPGEADDAVQKAWLRFSRTDTSAVENLGSWLTTVVSRVCLNMLQACRSRPESPLGEELPSRPRLTPALTPNTRRFSPTPQDLRLWWCSTR
jgi:DNA-directed RNA polymerase specialized sigma24 family protein